VHGGRCRVSAADAGLGPADVGLRLGDPTAFRSRRHRPRDRLQVDRRGRVPARSRAAPARAGRAGRRPGRAVGADHVRRRGRRVHRDRSGRPGPAAHRAGDASFPAAGVNRCGALGAARSRLPRAAWAQPPPVRPGDAGAPSPGRRRAARGDGQRGRRHLRRAQRRYAHPDQNGRVVRGGAPRSAGGGRGCADPAGARGGRRAPRGARPQRRLRRGRRSRRAGPRPTGRDHRHDRPARPAAGPTGRVQHRGVARVRGARQLSIQGPGIHGRPRRHAGRRRPVPRASYGPGRQGHHPRLPPAGSAGRA